MDIEASVESEDAGAEGPGGAGEDVFDASEDDDAELPDDEATEDDCDEEVSLVPVSVSLVLLGVGIRGTFFTSRIFLTSNTPFSFSAAAEAAAAFSAALVATACCSMLAL